MTRAVYARFLSLVVFFCLILSGCGQQQPYYSPWVMSQPVEKNGVRIEGSKPFFGWQTDRQRRQFATPMPVPQAMSTPIPAPESAPVAENAILETPVISHADETFGAAPEKQDNIPAVFRDIFIPKPPAPSKTADTPGSSVTVALLLPLSGKNAALGRGMLNAAQLAFFDIGYSGLKLMPRDTKDTPEGAAKAAEDAIRAGASLILGPIFSEHLSAVKPVAAQNGVPVVSFSTDWKQAGHDTYLMGFMPFVQVSRIAGYAHAKGYSRFAVFSPSSEYSDVVLRALGYALDEYGLRVVQTGHFSPMQSDLIEIVGDFINVPIEPGENGKPGKPSGLPAPAFDALLLPMGSESLKSVTNILNYYNLDSKTTRLLGTGLWDDPALAREASLYGGWFAASDPALRTDFERRYQETYQAAAPRLATLAYDATALAAVLAQSATEEENPFSADRMTNPRGFAGIDGIFRFRPDGLVERGLAVLEIRSTGFKVIDPAPTSFSDLTN